MSAAEPTGLLALPAHGLGEVAVGHDLVALLDGAWAGAGTSVQDGDVVVVTSKVVSKAEGRVVSGPGVDKEAAVDAETDREVARRGPTRIVRTRHGLVMAAAGVDASNVESGSLVLLPRDPDGSARHLRERFQQAGVCVGVVVSDTSGRAWRHGQTDIAIGAAGLVVLDDHGGRVDAYGNALVVTAPAVADEVAAAAELATGKLSRSPACLLRGLARFVLPPGQHGPGAAALVRPEETDMFGLGAREAVTAAIAAHDEAAPRGFGAAASSDELLRAITGCVPAVVPEEAEPDRLRLRLPDDPFEAGAAAARTGALLAAYGWRAEQTARNQVVAVGPPLDFSRRAPGPTGSPPA